MIQLKSICRGPRLQKDTGYAWVILVMSCLSHSVHLGFSFAVLGNLTIAHEKAFGIGLQQSSLIGSVHTAVFFMFGPIASVLLKKFGCRMTQILGGICVILGVGLSSLSTESWHAFLLFGVLAGIGISNCYITTSEILALYFDKYKYLAFSAAILGQYAGVAAWPIVSQLLLDNFGYSKAMGILASLHITHIIAGLFFYQPPTEHNDTNNSDNNNDYSNENNSNNNNAIEEGIDSIPAGENNNQIKIISNVYEQQQEEDGGKVHLAMDVNQVEILHHDLCKEKVQDEESDPFLSRKREMQIIEEEDITSNIKHDFCILLKSPKVWALLTNAMLWNLNVTGFYIFINDFIVHKTGSSEEEAAIGLTIVGAANIVGSLIVMAISSLKFDRLNLHFCCTTIYGITTIVTAFSTDKMMFYILSGIWGLAVGASIANMLGFICGFCDTKQLAVLFGLHMFAEGISSLGGIPLVGYVSMKLGPQYRIILLGCCGIVAAWCILPVIVQRTRKACRTIKT